MKKALIIGGSVLAGLIVVFFVVAMFLPREFQVSRTTVVHAPAEHVFDLVNHLRTFTEWSPWRAVDPTIEYTFSDKQEGEGAWYQWKSEDSGRGTMTIVKSERPREIRTALAFEHGKMALRGGFLFEPVAEGTSVTWIIEGDDGGHLPHRYFFLIMDVVAGHMCTDGLDRLKEFAESTLPEPIPAPQASDGGGTEER